MEAALFEPGIANLNPCKHVREWKCLATSSGAVVYENTPAIAIDYCPEGVRIQTPRGDVVAGRVVLATNGYTQLLDGAIGSRLQRDQSPLWPQNSMSEPLTQQQWESIGWGRRCPVKATGNLFFHMVPTRDGRILVSFPHLIGHAKGAEMNMDYNARGRDQALAYFRHLFPALADLRFTQTWGGPISATMDLLPHIGFLDRQRRVAYSTGCWGHGVALSQQNGRTLAELLLDQETERTRAWFVNRRPFRWPPDPLGYIGRMLTLVLVRRMDRRSLRQAGLRLD